MKGLRNRLILLFGMLITVTGYILNNLVSRYQGLYRSLQFRNIKLEETFFTVDVKRILMLLIGMLVFGVLGQLFIKKRHLLKQKGIAIFGTMICGGQTLNVLSSDGTRQMGIYVLFAGYLLMLIGFLLSLYEKEREVDEV